MPHKFSNSLAWWRVVLSALKPSQNMQLVLSAHLKYVNQDGARCRVSLRRLAVDLDSNEDTIVTSEDFGADICSQTKSMEGSEPNHLNERLRTWLESSQHVQKYQHDPEALALMTPLRFRFAGYEGLIRQWCSNLKKYV
jgi:hypothetical protein